ncbi:hypothetical protein [Caulobacter hibisci]|uniref:DUF1206 domain-containing protein n=1 Tax=Caulobacter hibisci TaxID=2035993 RepID=A0ABS0T7Z1_9CAUL|nr:hypothetical protein [Caulobacter hibisci]MBI1686962.1 hypothetical protein [Caulobacter hibisci]
MPFEHPDAPVAIVGSTPPNRPWAKAPAWVLAPMMGLAYLVSIIQLGFVLTKAGPPFITALNGIHSWHDLGGLRGLGVGLSLAIILAVFASGGWFFAVMAKSLEDELKRRMGL